MTWRRGTFSTVLILSPLAVAFAFALDMYIPTLPTVMQQLHTQQRTLQLTLSLFLIFTGIGQLLIGPWSDHHGRRRPVVASILLYILASLWCAFANSISSLIVARIFEALGACGMMVIANAVVRDVFDESKSARIYSFLNGSVSFSPMIAPIIGGYLGHAYGWRSNFIFLMILGLLALLVVLIWQPESLKQVDRISFNKRVFVRYGEILKHPRFLFFTFCALGGVSCFFTFFSLSPYILINHLGVSEQHFGFYFGVFGFTFFIGSLIAGSMVTRAGVYNTVMLGVWLMLLGGLAMVVLNVCLGLTRGDFVWPMLGIGTGGAFMIGAGMAGALAPFGQMAGTAAAVAGAIEFFFSAIVGYLALMHAVTSDFPLALVALLFGGIALFCMLVFRRHLKH